MGVKLGGEDIRFQDLAFNLNFPTKKAGTFMLFGMGGLSSNVFEAAKDTSQWFVQKDGFDIYYKNQMGAAGLTHSLNIGKKLLWRTVIATSGLKNTREGYVLSKVNFQRYLIQADSSTRAKTSITTSLSYKFNNRANLKVGVFVTQLYDELFSRSADKRANGAAMGLIIQPFANLHWAFLPKLSTNIGLHYLNYTFNQTKSVEPRFSLKYQFSNNQTLSFAYGLHSQLQQPEIYFALATQNSTFLGNSRLDVTKSRHYVLSHQYSIKRGSNFKTEFFYQQIFNVPAALLNPTFSTLNLVEDFTPEPLQNAGTGRNYGLEFTYQQYLTKGFHVLSNASFYKATYKNGDGVERNSRFNGKHIFNLTLGKEWESSKIGKPSNRIIGTSIRVIWLGGFYEREVNEQASIDNKRLIYRNADAFTIKQPDYFRPDFRIYLKKSKEKYSRTLALDIQNIANYQNISYRYYDILQNKIVRQYQMGLIPILSYRWEF
jgi:outer membrane receptor for ferrienterochelin and colicin